MSIGLFKVAMVSFLCFLFLETSAGLCSGEGCDSFWSMTNRCLLEAANKYQISPLLVWGIIKTESNFNWKALGRNSDGSYDIGIMQINSRWLPFLKKYGIDEKSLWHPCINIYVGTWILASCVAKYGYTWDAVGCYNARSLYKKRIYAWKVYREIEPYLNSKFGGYRFVKSVEGKK